MRKMTPAHKLQVVRQYIEQIETHKWAVIRKSTLGGLGLFHKGAVCVIYWSSSSILCLAFLPMVSPLHYLALLSSLYRELDRLRLAFAAYQLLDSIR